LNRNKGKRIGKRRGKRRRWQSRKRGAGVEGQEDRRAAGPVPAKGQKINRGAGRTEKKKRNACFHGWQRF